MAFDQVVSAQDVLRAVMELRRRGVQSMMEELEKLEPDLTEFCLEELGLVHQQLLDLGAKPRQVRRLAHRIESMALVLVTALRRGQLRLWEVEAAEGPLAKLDPDPPARNTQALEDPSGTPKHASDLPSDLPGEGGSGGS